MVRLQMFNQIAWVKQSTFLSAPRHRSSADLTLCLTPVVVFFPSSTLPSFFNCMKCPVLVIITVHEMPGIVIPLFLILLLLIITVHEMPCIVIPSFLILLLLILCTDFCT